MTENIQYECSWYECYVAGSIRPYHNGVRSALCDKCDGTKKKGIEIRCDKFMSNRLCEERYRVIKEERL